MAYYEITPGTIGNDVQPTKAGFLRRSLNKFLRIGHKKIRVFVIVPSGATISETIPVMNGRRGEIWGLNHGALNLNLISVTPTTSGKNTSYAIAEATQAWTAKHILFVVEVPY